MRKSPFFDATMQWGVKAFSIYNHMYLPRSFGSEEENFWNLVKDAILCDVAAERQVEIGGPDAARFVQMLTPRNLSKVEPGECKYVLITDSEGGLLNDPLLFKLAEDRFWLSLSDSDIMLYAKGVAVNSGMDVRIFEPDASPLQLQGPKSPQVMRELFGDAFDDLEYFHHRPADLDDIPLIVSRTGWSKEHGYELFLLDHRRGSDLFDRIMAAGKPHGLKPGHTSTIRRIEGALLSYRADADQRTNPYELNLGRLVDLDMETDFIGKKALSRINEKGPDRRQVGLVIEGAPMRESNTEYWPVYSEGAQVGQVTSAIYSPRLEQNIALALVVANKSGRGSMFEVDTPQGQQAARVVELPFVSGNETGG
ncbi:glycine cleavage T C-terminal barrel domain-containing protein [Aurantiacibacter poecillastricola]|uniref:glycine cleavage T C-terminal barrel domain-containing protein n=1 Tax=Aurantiacibacter poecillastricola TaxID=3064385 RepID=UPI00273D930B|nr:glycine cleavage T C-terminal barrel domain-containing protein [Aurantiacibacter sp. 219JJ12-13]MDP5263183.1 glycine cleavage T C-terminal barrel domain-containing protein [Aurantiacibacter sp. 219JJ12-13]